MKSNITNTENNSGIDRARFTKTEAATTSCSWKKVFWKYVANLQENTHAEVWYQ